MQIAVFPQPCEFVPFACCRCWVSGLGAVFRGNRRWLLRHDFATTRESDRADAVYKCGDRLLKLDQRHYTENKHYDRPRRGHTQVVKDESCVVCRERSPVQRRNAEREDSE